MCCTLTTARLWTTIAPERVDLQNRITRVTAVKDNDTNGGRTKIDISWKPTYSYKTQGSSTDTTLGTADDEPVPAAQYRIQWSTNPDGSEWNLLDQNDEPGMTVNKISPPSKSNVTPITSVRFRTRV